MSAKENIKDIVGIKGTVKEHLKHRLHWKTMLKECCSYVAHKVLPHGADEVGNLIWTGTAYWPGSGGNIPKPIAPGPTETPVDPGLSGDVYGPGPSPVWDGGVPEIPHVIEGDYESYQQTRDSARAEIEHDDGPRR